MKRNCRIGLFCCVLTSLVWMNCGPVAAQESPESLLIADELRSLTAAINSLAGQLSFEAEQSERDSSLQKLDIAINYLNFRSRRIEMFERELQANKASRNRFEGLLAQFDREEETLPSSFDPGQQDALRKARGELNFRRQVIKDRISNADEEIVILENRILDMQSQIDSVETYVQKNLQF